VLRDPRTLQSAERAAHFVLSRLRRPDGGIFRTARAGRAHLPGCLDDYAYLADGLITLFEAGDQQSFWPRRSGWPNVLAGFRRWPRRFLHHGPRSRDSLRSAA